MIKSTCEDALNRGQWNWHFVAEAKTTEPQREILDSNEHLVLAGQLDDGDLLILDKLEGAGPYVLTRDGKVQGVDYHYHKYHAYPTPPGGKTVSDADLAPGMQL